MKIQISLYLFAAFQLVSSWAFAQPGNFRFTLIQSPNLPFSVKDIDQDSLGFIWVSGSFGLTRWDGTDVMQLQHVEGDSNSLIHNDILETHISSDGIFWIGTIKGLSRYDSKRQTFTHYPGDGPNPVLAHPIVYALAEDHEKYIWVGSRRDGLTRLDPRTGTSEIFKHNPEDSNSISGNRIQKILVDSKGRIWIAVKDGGLDLFLPSTNSFRNYPAQPGSNTTLVSDQMRDLVEGQNGKILVAAAGGGYSELNPETGLFTHFLHDPEDPTSPSDNQGHSLLYDSKGNTWFGTWAHGLNFKAKGSTGFRRFRPSQGDPTSLPGKSVVKIFEDRQGLIWVGTAKGGLAVVDPRMEERFVHFRNQPDNPNSLCSNVMGGILQVNENELWMGTYTAGLSIYYRDKDLFESHPHIPGDPYSLPNNGVWDIFKDQQERIWVGTSRGLSLWNPVDHNFTNYGYTPGSPPQISNRNVISMGQAPEGKLWIGTWGGGLNLFDPVNAEFQHMEGAMPHKIDLNRVKTILQTQSGTTWFGGTMGIRIYDPKTNSFSRFHANNPDSSSYNITDVNSIVQDVAGNIWIGFNEGLKKYDVQHQTLEQFEGKPGLENLMVLGLCFDPQGRLWVSANRTIRMLDPKTEEVKTYYYIDGTQSDDYVSFSFASSGQRRIQFGGTNGMTEVITDFVDSLVHPPLVFTDFRLFNQIQKPKEEGPLKKAIAQAKQVVLNYKDYLFSFGFTALDYRKPQSYQYAYRLTGFDGDWIYTDQNNRRATFTNVPHGNYLLEVKASLDGENWGPPASLGIRIFPPWWKTWWARTIFVAAALLLLFGIYTARVRTLRRQKWVLEQQVKERTAEVVAQKEEISVEKARSEALLLNILPESIAEELKSNEKAETKHFESVSVLFTDFVGFTKIAEQLSPDELVRELDLFFRGFDGIVGRLELEKIKTIGDAYMCAAGLPEPIPDHAERLVQAGLEMLEFVRETNLTRQRENRPTWDIRIGIHSGPVVAGVVGNKKFAYDIWGDAVNTASRMESSGVVNQLNISQSTYELVKETFACVYRGKVHAKNKGEIEMYRVESMKEN